MIKYLYTFILSLVLTVGFGQTSPSFNASLLQNESSFFKETVHSILEDSRGFLWVGTANGLYLYDGYSIVPFFKRLPQFNGLNGIINKIIEDPEGNIWIATTGSGLNKYIWDEDRLITFANDESIQILQNNDINAIAIDGNNLWIGYRWGGVDLLNTNTNQIQTVIINHDDVRDISEIAVFGDFIFLGVWKKGLFSFNNQTRQLNRIELPVKDYEKSTISAIYNDQNRNLWVGDRNANIFKIQINGDSLNVQKYSLNETNNTHINDITSIDNNVLLATSSGPYILPKDSQTPIKLSIGETFSNKLLISITSDISGNIWSGSSSGLLKLSPSLFENLDLGMDRNINVTAVQRKSKETIILGTWGQGIYNFNTDLTGNTSISKIKGTENLEVYSLYFDENSLFVGLNSGGILKYDFESQLIERNWCRDLSDKMVIKIIELNEKTFLVGTTSGLFTVSKEGIALNNINVFTGTDFDKTEINVTDMLMASDNTIWIGSALNGLYHITSINDIADWKIESYLSTGNASSELSENFISAISEDKLGNIWVGTENKGVNLWTRDEPSLFKNYSIDNGLQESRVTAIIEDLSGNLWVVGETSVSRLRPESDSFIGYDNNNSFYLDHYCCPGGLIRSGLDKLLIGSNNGLISFELDLSFSQMLNPVQLKSIEVLTNDQNQFEINDFVTDKLPLWNSERIVLDHNVRSIVLELISPNFSEHSSVLYQYRLEGFDTEWITVSPTRRFVTYSNLTPGDYNFQYRVVNKDGVYSPIKSIELSQIPPFWLSGWAYLAYFLMTLVIVYGLRKVLKYQWSLKEKIKTETIIRKKEREISDLKLKLFTDISHEIRTPLTLIIGPVERMVEKYVDYSEITDDLITVQRNASKILSMVEDVLSVDSTKPKRLVFFPEKRDIVKFLEFKARQFVHLAEKKNIVYTLNVNLEYREMTFDQDKLEEVINNLLINAFKYAMHNQCVIIEITNNSILSIPSELIKLPEDDSLLTIAVYNSGNYIPEDEKADIFERYTRGANTTEQTDGFGLGLSIVKELVSLQHGEIKFESKKAFGTCFWVTLPIFEQSADIELNEYLDLKPYSLNLYEPSHDQKKSQESTLAAPDSLPKILIIEDDNDLLTFVKSLFQSDFDVETVSDGTEGMKAIKEIMPDIVISDVMLPGMSGIEICKSIKGDLTTCHIPVILLTALSNQDSILTGIELGADAYITKPFSSKFLLAKVKSILSIRKHIYSRLPVEYILNPKKSNKNKGNQDFLNKLNMQILENLSKTSMTVEDLAEKMGISRVHLFRKITDLTELSPTEYVRTVRLKQASMSLLEGDVNISEIAYEHGFSSPNYFSISFKKFFGMTPSQFIENKKNETKSSLIH